MEIREFLEGLLEGFRAAAAANAAQGGPKWGNPAAAGARGGKGAWSDLDDLERTLPSFNIASDMRSTSPSAAYQPPSRGASPSQAGRSPAPKKDAFASDPLSTMMRRHALRSFLEEQCGSVAKAFDQMAAIAMRSNSGTQGGVGQPDQRMKYKFGSDEFQKTLSWMGYGVGAGKDWWSALFKSLDVDEDSFVTLQDMYDALVLDLPPAQAGPNVFFSAGGGDDGGTPRSAGKRPGGTPRSGKGMADDLLSMAEAAGAELDDEDIAGRPARNAWGDEAAFDKIDLNHDGTIDRREYEQARERGVIADCCDVCGTPYGKKSLFCQHCGTKRPS